MSVGDGIFAGCLFLGFIYLYTATRATWSWRRIAKRGALGTAILFSLGACSIAAYVGYDRWKTRAAVVTSLEGVSLGESISDVAFRLGPLSAEKVTDPKPDEQEQWFHQSEKRLWMATMDSRVVRIGYSCDERLDFTTVNRVSCGFTSEKIREEFPDSLRVLCKRNSKPSDAQSTRLYDVPKFGTRYVLSQNRVVNILVIPVSDLENKTKASEWEPCA